MEVNGIAQTRVFIQRSLEQPEIQKGLLMTLHQPGDLRLIAALGTNLPQVSLSAVRHLQLELDGFEEQAKMEMRDLQNTRWDYCERIWSRSVATD
jgi:hypothetical protein